MQLNEYPGSLGYKLTNSSAYTYVYVAMYACITIVIPVIMFI